MKGKNTFTEVEVARIKQLIVERCNASSSGQKSIRDKMRAIGFYGGDDFGIKNMTVEKFEGLIKGGAIKIVGNGNVKQVVDKALVLQPCVMSQPKESLSPLIDNNAEILILGTMPGETSLQKGEYYASSNNSFWKIIDALFNEKKGFRDYKEKEICLKKHCIALWDVLSCCNREGSSDVSITNEKVNDIEGLLKKYPRISKIVYNGKKASSYCEIDPKRIKTVVAESTSNANAKELEAKINDWQSKLK